MRFNILPMIAVAATLPSVSVSAPTDSIIARDNTAAIIGTWEDSKCAVSKVDDSIQAAATTGASECKQLRGNSMQVFWQKKGCTVLLFKTRDCRTNPDTAGSLSGGWNRCFDNSQYFSWTTYCQ